MSSRKLPFFPSSAAIVAPLLLAAGQVPAAAFDPGIVINASAQLDTSAPTSGSPSQSATLSLTAGTVPVTPTSYDGTTLTGNNPLQGTLTDIGDSIGISLSAAGAEGDESLFFGEFFLGLTNTTGTDYKVFLGFATTNSVLLPGGVAGDDVFGINEFYMEDEDTGEELNFSYRELDLFNDVDSTSASAPSNYIVVVEDGQTVFLYGLNIMNAGAFDPGTGFDVELATTISVLNVVPIPLPPAVFLFGSGALLVSLTGRSGTRRPGAGRLTTAQTQEGFA